MSGDGQCLEQILYLHGYSVPVQNDFNSEPKEGWKVRAFHYHTEHEAGSGYCRYKACVFLGEDGEGVDQGVQWWMYQEPTVFHGNWRQGSSTLHLRFNARGPVDADGSARPMYSHYLQKRPPSQEHLTSYYEGHDHSHRRIKMIEYGAYIMQKEGEQLVWADLL
jgi:hypothetical protein